MEPDYLPAISLLAGALRDVMAEGGGCEAGWLLFLFLLPLLCCVLANQSQRLSFCCCVLCVPTQQTWHTGKTTQKVPRNTTGTACESIHSIVRSVQHSPSAEFPCAWADRFCVRVFACLHAWLQAICFWAWHLSCCIHVTTTRQRKRCLCRHSLWSLIMVRRCCAVSCVFPAWQGICVYYQQWAVCAWFALCP